MSDRFITFDPKGTKYSLSPPTIIGLSGYLAELRNVGQSYSKGIALAKEYVTKNGGEISEDDDITYLKLFGEEASCFQPYPDINKFYFEL